jgi:hypothetical protein
MDFIKDVYGLDCMVLHRSNKGSIGKVDDTLHQVV